MSRKPEKVVPYMPGDYLQPSYDDPAFYDPRQEDPLVGELPDAEDGWSEMSNGEESAPVSEEKARVRNERLGATEPGLALKLETLLVLLMDIKWVALLGKFGLASVSALVSMAIYAYLFGWSFAIGLVALLFLHEMGHAIVMKLKGIPLRGMIFIPMLGAAVLMRQVPGNARDEAEIGIAGPIAGALAALACLLLAHTQAQATGHAGIWGLLAYFGCFLNLSNLLPMMPFDGGRVMAAIDRRIWIIGFLLLISFQVWQWLMGSNSVWLLLFVIIGAADFWARRGTWQSPQAQTYYMVPVRERIIIGLAYFALATALVLGMTLAHDIMYL